MLVQCTSVLLHGTNTTKPESRPHERRGKRRNSFARSNLLTMRGGVIEIRRPPHSGARVAAAIPAALLTLLPLLTHPHTVLGVDLVSYRCFLESPLLSFLSHLGPNRG